MRLFCMLCVASLAGACAKGASGGNDGGGGRQDAAFDAPFGRDVGARDSGGRDVGLRDTGPACMDDLVGDTCEEAMDLGTLDVGSMMVVTGKLPMLTDADWYQIAFPAVNMPGSMFGGGMPTLNLEGDATMVFSLETECGTTASCGEGTSRELTSYSFVDDQSTGPDPVLPGGMRNDFSTRDVPWPGVLRIRVARRGGPVDCSDYTLTISR